MASTSNNENQFQRLWVFLDNFHRHGKLSREEIDWTKKTVETTAAALGERHLSIICRSRRPRTICHIKSWWMSNRSDRWAEREICSHSIVQFSRLEIDLTRRRHDQSRRYSSPVDRIDRGNLRQWIRKASIQLRERRRSESSWKSVDPSNRFVHFRSETVRNDWFLQNRWKLRSRRRRRFLPQNI